jgi:hypothetical protein
MKNLKIPIIIKSSQEKEEKCVKKPRPEIFRERRISHAQISLPVVLKQNSILRK